MSMTVCLERQLDGKTVKHRYDFDFSSLTTHGGEQIKKLEQYVIESVIWPYTNEAMPRMAKCTLFLNSLNPEFDNAPLMSVMLGKRDETDPNKMYWTLSTSPYSFRNYLLNNAFAHVNEDVRELLAFTADNLTPELRASVMELEARLNAAFGTDPQSLYKFQFVANEVSKRFDGLMGQLGFEEQLKEWKLFSNHGSWLVIV